MTAGAWEESRHKQWLDDDLVVVITVISSAGCNYWWGFRMSRGSSRKHVDICNSFGDLKYDDSDK